MVKNGKFRKKYTEILSKWEKNSSVFNDIPKKEK